MITKKINILDFLGVSLVAYYGSKPLALQQLILDLQQSLQASFPNNFIPYKLEQVHATIIGCEGIKTEAGIVNQWFYTLRNEIKYIDYAGLLNYFQSSPLLPLDIYFGGYKSSINYQFLSRNKHPRDRSFQLQKSSTNTLIPIIMGWSMKNQIITDAIDKIRRDLQQFNCLHKYHQLPQDIDNDFYLRLGTITGSVNSDLSDRIQEKINYYLQNLAPIIISLSQENLAIVKYQDLTLPLATTQCYSCFDLYSREDTHGIEQLYK